jgi:hypothetical protein
MGSDRGSGNADKRQLCVQEICYGGITDLAHLCSFFAAGQAFLSMLCGMRWGTFIFFAAWVVIMTVFIYFLAPETKRVPVERVAYLFARHPVWAKFMGPKVANEILSTEKARSAAGAENGARLSGLIDGEGGGGTGDGVSAQRVQK